MRRGKALKFQFNQLISIGQNVNILIIIIYLQCSERLHQEWMERERIAQEEFRVKKEREDAAQQKKEEEEVNL